MVNPAFLEPQVGDSLKQTKTARRTFRSLEELQAQPVEVHIDPRIVDRFTQVSQGLMQYFTTWFDYLIHNRPQRKRWIDLPANDGFELV